MKPLRKQKTCSDDVELEIQKLVELEAREFARLEQRYTEDDLAYSWQMGYDARKKEESERFLLWW